ncbi:hypothetical protein [Streptomyces sp. H27-C3]|uniref:RICIN domain-containing protein n=1 Tax=Streptomyces sp. H27-C3 TaxID=3046305 RepID=UPI0024B9EEDE|nr:hypothetical protein [Streptomyces sp. H27-C3]MDJ0461236.1 hypothetical protein [Streptomyces sp. H27-C3]
MTGQGDSELGDAQDAAAFMELLRRLKKRSRLSFRQLEQRAADADDMLPRSTLYNMLARDVPPRPELLTAFVRACGDGDRVPEWLAAWDRVAGPAPGTTDRPATGAQQDVVTAQASRRESTRTGRTRDLGPGRLAIAALTFVLVAAAVTTALLRGDEGRDGSSGAPPRSFSAAPSPISGWVTIHLAVAPELCLTDGRVRDWRHTPLVAVQRPCKEAAPQSTLLELVRENLYRIQWHHPDYGKGCLQALADSRGAGLLEPMDDCEDGSLFRVEPSGELGKGRFVLRVEGRGCVGIAGSSQTEGAEAVMQRCTGKGRQVFIIRAAN